MTRVALLIATTAAFGRGAAQIPSPPADTANRPRVDTAPAHVEVVVPTLDTAALKAQARKLEEDTDLREQVLWLIDDNPVIRARLAELAGLRPEFPVLRSTSTLLWQNARANDGVQVLWPQIQFVRNTSIPFSRNDGGLWAGRGWSSRISGGAAAKLGRVHIVIAPELVTTQNRFFPPRTDAIIPTPIIPPDRSPFAYPWYANGPYSLDMPLRFGDGPLKQLRPGQSSIFADIGGVSFGFATENEWWGPGIDNALVLSNNAPGFPHFFVRTPRSIDTRLGKIDFRWIVGGLSTSSFFDTTTNKDTRSIAAAVAVIRPRGFENLSIGVARSVVGTASGWGVIPLRWLDVFHNTGHPNDGAPYDSTLHPGGRDQLYSAFARWTLPASGAEIYGEWGRLDFPRNLRDLLVQPNRGQAYILGLQWTRAAFRPNGRVHVRIENTSLEQSLALRNKFAGVWYTSRRVLQGFTNEGQVLGAAVGPGSSGQNAELNYMLPRGYFGIEFGRTRYNEDVHQASPMLEYLRWCSHDVGLQWGLKGGYSSRFGSVSVRSLYQNRLNAYFQGGHGCPRSDGMVDIRNNNLTLTFSPGLHW